MGQHAHEYSGIVPGKQGWKRNDRDYTFSNCDASTSSEIILQLAPDVKDSIRCEIIRTDRGTAIKRGWLNGVEMPSGNWEIIK